MQQDHSNNKMIDKNTKTKQETNIPHNNDAIRGISFYPEDHSNIVNLRNSMASWILLTDEYWSFQLKTEKSMISPESTSLNLHQKAREDGKRCADIRQITCFDKIVF